MHAVNLIAPCLPDEALPETPQQCICAITGDIGPCIQRKHLLGKSFTNLDLLKAPASDFVSVAAYKALTYKWERMSSWFCNGKEMRLFRKEEGESGAARYRKELRDLILGANYPPVWAGYVTTSYKKHGALYASINHAPGQAVWRFENQNADCGDLTRLKAIWERLNAELLAGISRTVLESLEPTSYTFKAVGISGWLVFESWARPLCKSALYQFLCYLLPSQEELKNEAA